MQTGVLRCLLFRQFHMFLKEVVGKCHWQTISFKKNLCSQLKIFQIKNLFPDRHSSLWVTGKKKSCGISKGSAALFQKYNSLFAWQQQRKQLCCAPLLQLPFKRCSRYLILIIQTIIGWGFCCFFSLKKKEELYWGLPTCGKFYFQ